MVNVMKVYCPMLLVLQRCVGGGGASDFQKKKCSVTFVMLRNNNLLQTHLYISYNKVRIHILTVYSSNRTGYDLSRG